MASRARLGERAAVAPASQRRDGLPASRLARALRAHPHRTAAGLFALLVLAYLWPALIEGKLLAPLSALYIGVPWNHNGPVGVTHFMNPLLTDVPLSYYPWDVLARRLIHAGTFPAWNPTAFAGTPFFANPEVAWLSPFSLPLWILPLHYGLGLAAALKLWFAGFGTYLLARELELGFWPATLAGVSFTLCAFNIVWLSHGVQVSVAVLLPWTIWLAERIVRRGGAGAGLALAGIVAFVLTGGHPGTQLHVLSGTVLYALARAALSTDIARDERLRRLGLVALALGVGTLVAAAVLLPAVQASSGTVGAIARRDGGAGFPGATMPVSVLRAALFPEWTGRPSDQLIAAGPANYNERAFYAGIVALLFAAIALVSTADWRRKAPFALLGAIGLAVPLGAPGIHALVVALPLFDRVQDQRMLLWFLFAAAILAAFGLQAVLDAPRPQRRAWGVIAAAVLAAIVALASIDAPGEVAGPALRYVVRRSQEATEGVLALASVGWWLVFVLSTAALLLLARLRPNRRQLVGGLIALVAALDLLHVAHGYQPMGPASEVTPPPTGAISFMRGHVGDRRIAGLMTALPADWSTVYGLEDVRGYDAPQPSVRFAQLWKAISPQQADWTPFLVANLEAASVRVLGLLGARYVITGSNIESRDPSFPTVYRGHDAHVFENTLAAPHALIASRVVVARNEHDEIAAVTSEGFDPRSDVVVRQDQLGRPPPSRMSRGSVRVIREQNAEVTLHATVRRPGVVLLDDAWAPGWSVAVDGHPARALQADVVMRGVAVPAGSHTIVWSYRVPGLRLGLLLSALGLLAALAWGARLVRRARRRAPPPAAA